MFCVFISASDVGAYQFRQCFISTLLQTSSFFLDILCLYTGGFFLMAHTSGQRCGYKNSYEIIQKHYN